MDFSKILEDKKFVVNDREYEILNCNLHDLMRLVDNAVFLEKIGQGEDLFNNEIFTSCVDIVLKKVLFNSASVTLHNCKHFEEYPEDYLEVIVTAWGAFISRIQAKKKP